MSEIQTQTVERFPHVPQVHVLAAKLAQLLRTSEADRITDETLKSWVGLDCSPDGAGYCRLQTAIKILEREGQTWRRERGGNAIERLSPDQIIKHVEARSDHCRRVAKRNSRILYGVDPEKIPEARRSEYFASLAMNAAVAKLTGTPARKALQQTAISAEFVVDQKKLLESIKNANG